MCFSAPEYCSTNATNVIEKYVEYIDKVEKYENNNRFTDYPNMQLQSRRIFYKLIFNYKFRT